MMSEKRSSLKPIQGAKRSLRRRLGRKGELILALLPTASFPSVLALVEVLSRQRLLFASVASTNMYSLPTKATEIVVLLAKPHPINLEKAHPNLHVLGN